MELVTVGCEKFRGQKIPVCVAGLDSIDFLHDRQRFKILLLKNGSGVLSDGKITEFLLAPVMLLLNNRTTYRLDIHGDDASGTVLYFHPGYLNDSLDFDTIVHNEKLSHTDRQDTYLIRHFLPGKSLSEQAIHLEAAASRYFDNLFEKIRKELELQPDYYWPCRSRAFFIQALVMLDFIMLQKKQYEEKQDSSLLRVQWSVPLDTEGNVREILNFLMSNYQKKITIQGLAQSFHTNRTTLQAKFKKATGMSIAQYLIRLRVQIASILLKDTTITVSEIIDRTGFDDPTHFARMFKKYSNMTPSDYRALFNMPSYIQSQ